MQTVQGSTLNSLRNVQMFLNENAAKLPGVINTGVHQKLDQAIADLSEFASEQTGNIAAGKTATGQQRALRQALLNDHMAPIARIAKADLPFIPGLDRLKMPRGRPSVARLASLAEGMGKAATPFAHVFVEAGLAEDFLAQLNTASAALVQCVVDRSQTRGKHGGATKGLKKRLTSGRKIVHVLDALVKRALKNDPALLASWNIVKRVQKIPTRPALTAVATPAPTSPE